MAQNNKNELQGSMTALITPFKDGAIDLGCFARLVERQIAAGTTALVPVGTTGEAATLTMAERYEVVKKCVDVAAGRVPVIAGAGSNDTGAAVEIVQKYESLGVDAILALTGFYNKPSQAGLKAHFEAMHEACDLPLVIYNVPGRTVCDISVETLAELSRLERVVAVKDATGDLARVARQNLQCVPGFIQLSGEDITAVGFNAMGGRGCISVTSNVVPDICAQMQRACTEGRWADAQSIQNRLTPLHDALFADTSPGPVKYALSKLDLCSSEQRLPLVEPSDKAKRLVDEALASLDLE